MKAGNETNLVKACLQWLTLHGVFAWRVQQQGTFDPVRQVRHKFHGLKGVSDICGVLPGGRLLACEVKTATGVVRKEQQSFLDQVNVAGGLGIVVCSLDDLGRQLAPILHAGRR